ncbi:MAG: hypothetical protein RBU21_23110, partial [FCB group bacterium]|nr:hypothetical protein [FCB group bacterium]
LADTAAFILDGVRYHNHDITIAWAPATHPDTPDGLTGYRVYIHGRLAHQSQEIPTNLELPLT